MVNELRFAVEFTRAELETLLSNTNVAFIGVSGTYSYNPALGPNVWETNAFAEGISIDRADLNRPRVDACIQPCVTH